jgi:hypothetical protein
MLPARGVFATLLAAVLLPTPLPAAAQSVVGEAYSMDGSELQYREVHSCTSAGEQCLVEYRYPEGELFARKHINYSDSQQSPSLRIEDLRVGETVLVDKEFGDEVVVDAGFDHYVRLRWTELAGGEGVNFPFLVVGREKPIKMLARKDRDSDCPDTRLCLEITLDNWLLAAIVSPIELQYDQGSRRLLQFKGISNIRDDEGKSQDVRIIYRYTEELADTAS